MSLPLRQKAVNARRSCEKVQKAYLEQKSEISNLRKEVTDKERQNSALRHELTEKEEENTTLTQQLAGKEDEIKQLRAKLDEETQKRMCAEAQLLAAEMDFDEIQETLDFEKEMTGEGNVEEEAQPMDFSQSFLSKKCHSPVPVPGASATGSGIGMEKPWNPPAGLLFSPCINRAGTSSTTTVHGDQYIGHRKKPHGFDRINSNEFVMICKCGKAFLDGAELTKHIKRNTVLNFGCRLCTDRWHNFSAFKRHLTNAHGINLEQNETKTGCSTCGELYETRSAFTSHFWEFHGRSAGMLQADPAMGPQLPETYLIDI